MDEKTPVEIERKYVIRIPDVKVLEEQEGYTVSKIFQTYLESEPSVTRRVRRRIYDGRTVYTETKKVRIDEISSYEDEREVSENEYMHLLCRKIPGTKTLAKTRHTFVCSGQTFEVDIYPDWQESCIMETELASRNTEVAFPPFITVIKEVSGEKKYSNASISREFPDELIE